MMMSFGPAAAHAIFLIDEAFPVFKYSGKLSINELPIDWLLAGTGALQPLGAESDNQARWSMLTTPTAEYRGFDVL